MAIFLGRGQMEIGFLFKKVQTWRPFIPRHIFFANQGEFKTAEYEEIMNIASCLSLLSNAVLLWNTPKIYSLVEELKRSGIPVDDEDLKRISLLMFKHLIVHGSYDFRET